MNFFLFLIEYTDMEEKKIFFITCPECKQKVPMQSEYKPFCSYRCKIKDLAKWSDGSYSLAGEFSSTTFEDDENQ